MIEALPYVIPGSAMLAVLGWAGKKVYETIHDLELRMVKVETRAEEQGKVQVEVKEELGDIRQNMVRRHDLDAVKEALCQRIDDLRGP